MERKRKKIYVIECFSEEEQAKVKDFIKRFLTGSIYMLMAERVEGIFEQMKGNSYSADDTFTLEWIDSFVFNDILAYIGMIRMEKEKVRPDFEQEF